MVFLDELHFLFLQCFWNNLMHMMKKKNWFEFQRFCDLHKSHATFPQIGNYLSTFAIVSMLHIWFLSSITFRCHLQRYTGAQLGKAANCLYIPSNYSFFHRMILKVSKLQEFPTFRLCDSLQSKMLPSFHQYADRWANQCQPSSSYVWSTCPQPGSVLKKIILNLAPVIVCSFSALGDFARIALKTSTTWLPNWYSCFWIHLQPIDSHAAEYTISF